MHLPVQSLSFLLLIAYLPVATGCSHEVPIPKPAPGAVVSERLAGVVLLDRRRVLFEQQDGRLEAGWIIGHHRGSEIAISADSVSHLLVTRTDGLAIAGLVLGVTVLVGAAAGGVALAMKESCPFVYSWDGQSYVFDAEPYGGAVTRGLVREDFSRLEHLRPVDGEYRLLVVNEVRESQSTDLMELWVIDHAPSVRPIPDELGRLYSIEAPAPPIAARDRRGQDLLPWLGAADSLFWEPTPPLDSSSATRDTITAVFTRPSGASTMKLVVRAATGVWGSHQIRSLLSRMGSGLQDWYRRIDWNPEAADSVRRWAVLEGLYGLQIEVKEVGGWAKRGSFPGGGPFIAEDRVVSLDLGGVEGNEVMLRIRPAAGFWSLDWLAADFSSDDELAVDTVRVDRAIDPRLGDVTALLRRVDSMEHALPETGDRALVRFRAQPARPGRSRTVLLHTRGWYRLRGLPEWAGPIVSMDQLFGDPGLGARLSGLEYREARKHHSR